MKDLFRYAPFMTGAAALVGCFSIAFLTHGIAHNYALSYIAAAATGLTSGVGLILAIAYTQWAKKLVALHEAKEGRQFR